MSLTATIRRFNRSYTQRIGALDESFLGLGIPLASARLLFEIGTGETSVADLRARLSLDSGYLSRLLRRLEEAGHVKVAPDPTDRRRRVARLTTTGRGALLRLERRSEELAADLVAALTPRQRERLEEALATADLLVRAATVTLREVDAGSAEARAALEQYVAELVDRFPAGFEPGELPAPDAFVVASSDGVVVACGAVQQIAPGVAEVKRMWVDASWRGAGLGARLLRHLESVAAERGHRVCRLDTNGTLTEAIAMYDRAGYRRIERYNDNPYAEAFFEKDLGVVTASDGPVGG